MAWGAPPTFAAGTVCTAGNLNILSADLDFLANIPQGRLFGAFGQSIPNATWTPVGFSNTNYALNGMTVGSGSGLVFPFTGLYIMTAQIHWASFGGTSSPNIDIAFFTSHGAGAIALKGTTVQNNGTSSSGIASVVSAETRCTAGDELTVVVYQDSGSSQLLAAAPGSGIAGDAYNYFSVSWRSF